MVTVTVMGVGSKKATHEKLQSALQNAAAGSRQQHNQKHNQNHSKAKPEKAERFRSHAREVWRAEQSRAGSRRQKKGSRGW
jgi:hypothetical protein